MDGGFKAEERKTQSAEAGGKGAGEKAVEVDEKGVGVQWAPLFYPSWEILPHEARLPHADVISERLETLVYLSEASTKNAGAMLTVSVQALLQKTYPAGAIRERTRVLRTGQRTEPLDFVEWLEGQGYEPEAQVTAKGEIALRGGILDIFPLTSPWPVRLEFFGDELESMRFFDPMTQISREKIEEVIIPPAGELGILKRELQVAETGSGPPGELGLLLDYLPEGTLFLVCEADEVAKQAEEYGRQVPEGDVFYISWPEFQAEAIRRGMLVVKIAESGEAASIAGETGIAESVTSPAEGDELSLNPLFESLDAYRPLAERAPDPQIAETQRREFFAQLHRWLRQDYSVTIFCNNEGEAQRFREIWDDYGFGAGIEQENGAVKGDGKVHGERPNLRTGALARGFLCEPAKVVVVTDAEVFGRYKVQRPRRLKSPHAQATRSALDIDFTELEEGDYVVHLQHGIGRYLGLQLLPLGAGTKPMEAGNPGLKRNRNAWFWSMPRATRGSPHPSFMCR